MSGNDDDTNGNNLSNDSNTNFEISEKLKSRCQRKFSWSEEFATKALLGYRQWMKLCLQQEDYYVPKILAPSPVVLKVWEQHVLEVGHYTKSCMEYAGRLILLDPDAKTTKQQISGTKLSLNALFGKGKINETIWSFEEPEEEQEGEQQQQQQQEGVQQQQQPQESEEATANSGDQSTSQTKQQKQKQQQGEGETTAQTPSKSNSTTTKTVAKTAPPAATAVAAAPQAAAVPFQPVAAAVPMIPAPPAYPMMPMPMPMPMQPPQMQFMMAQQQQQQQQFAAMQMQQQQQSMMVAAAVNNAKAQVYGEVVRANAQETQILMQQAAIVTNQINQVKKRKGMGAPGANNAGGSSGSGTSRVGGGNGSRKRGRPRKNSIGSASSEDNKKRKNPS